MHTVNDNEWDYTLTLLLQYVLQKTNDFNSYFVSNFPSSNLEINRECDRFHSICVFFLHLERCGISGWWKAICRECTLLSMSRLWMSVIYWLTDFWRTRSWKLLAVALRFLPCCTLDKHCFGDIEFLTGSIFARKWPVESSVVYCKTISDFSIESAGGIFFMLIADELMGLRMSSMTVELYRLFSPSITSHFLLPSTIDPKRVVRCLLCHSRWYSFYWLLTCRSMSRGRDDIARPLCRTESEDPNSYIRESLLKARRLVRFVLIFC